MPTRRAPPGTSAIVSQVSKLAHSLGKSEAARAFGVSRSTINRLLQAEAQGRYSKVVTTKRGLAKWQERVTASKPVAKEIRAERREMETVRREARSTAAQVSKKFRPKDIAKALEETIGGKRSYQQVAADLKRIKEGRGDAGLLEQLQQARDYLAQNPYPVHLPDGTTLIAYQHEDQIEEPHGVRATVWHPDDLQEGLKPYRAAMGSVGIALLEVFDDEGKLGGYQVVVFESPIELSLSDLAEYDELGE